MSHLSLDQLLRSGKWKDAEFKAAQNVLPKSVFETVATFANTRDGWIVPEVTQDGERLFCIAENQRTRKLAYLDEDGRLGSGSEARLLGRDL